MGLGGGLLSEARCGRHSVHVRCAAAAMDVDDGPSRDSLVRFEIAEP
ncbi:hypothetical protein L842_2564 [Mycobacterium intracellulare MIN_052511_1280]|nr:hypothetical protein L842_2564 [Mycobacterium intracellulare MIN_052511_1280]